MKNVLLIGDSIRMGYDKSVKRTLEGKAGVYYPSENCRFASYVLRYLHEYKMLVKDEQVDVVHWNAGLWDCLRMYDEEPFTPIDVYAYYIERICVRIQKLFPEAKVIFATSTSIREGSLGVNFKRYNKDIEAYNAAAVAQVKKYGHIINDLYALSLKLPQEAHSDAVHYYTSIGTEALTNQVLSCLASTLELEEIPMYREELYTDAPIGI